jgi:cysteine-S-conjugate beta-lyase
MTNFDEIIDRRHSNSYKWDKYANPDIIPAWVADMDFKAAPPILEAMQRVTDHGVYGYAQAPAELNLIVIERLRTRHNWDIKPEWLVWLGGLVPALGLSVRAFTQAQEAVMTPVPVYYPFMTETRASQREIQKTKLILKNNRWTFDFEAIRASITPQTKLFLLCNPHNPGGTVFTKEELTELADICNAHGIVICSDEIHCDLLIDPTATHISIAVLNEATAQNSVTLLSPSKTFNIAGLGGSFAVIPNEALRAKFTQTKAGLMPMLSAYSYEAALAAYRDGADWHGQLLDYLRLNHQLVLDTVAAIPTLQMVPLEATYLAWIDARATGIANVAQHLEAAGVGISDGAGFDGEGFFRLNMACPRATLEEILRRIKAAFTA